jgi:hypothetical protein
MSRCVEVGAKYTAEIFNYTPNLPRIIMIYRFLSCFIMSHHNKKPLVPSGFALYSDFNFLDT